jgi:hypothetical protein
VFHYSKIEVECTHSAIMVEYSDQKGNIKFFAYTVLVGCYLIELSMTTVSKCLCAFTVEDIVKLLLTVYIYIIFAADSKL